MVWHPNHRYGLLGLGAVNNLIKFADRLRRLREAAGLTIEQASERGELSPGFWGEVERYKKEPGLDSIVSMAKGVGTTPPVLIMLESEEADSELRKQVQALLDLLPAQKLELIHQIAKLVLDYPG